MTYDISICVDNDIVTIVIWCEEARVNFSKTAKLREPVGLVQFLVIEKFTSAYLCKGNIFSFTPNCVRDHVTC